MMKVFSLVLFLTVCLCLANCHKVSTDVFGDHPEIRGDYDWVLSEIDYNNVISSESEGEKFGVRFKNHRKVVFYHNGEIFENARVQSYHESSGSILFYVTTNSGVDYSFAYTNGHLQSDNFPIKAIYNEFTKIK